MPASAMQGFLSVFWQIAVVLLGILVVAFWSDLAQQSSKVYSPQVNDSELSQQN